MQLAELNGMEYIISSATPMLEKMFEEHQVVYEPLTPGLILSEVQTLGDKPQAEVFSNTIKQIKTAYRQ